MPRRRLALQGNPIITRDAVPDTNSIFNSAVVPFGDGFAGVFRCDNTAARDAAPRGAERGWHPLADRAADASSSSVTTRRSASFVYGYDPRVCWLEDRYYVTWCNGYHGPTIGVGYTHDFQTFHQLENAFLPYNRNGVLFPRRIGGKYAMLSRPSDTGHTPFGDIFYSESPDLIHWGHHRTSCRADRRLAGHQDRRRARRRSRRPKAGCCSTTACSPRATASCTALARRCWTWRDRGR